MTYEMLTGRLPFSGDTQGALLVKHVSEPVPDVREVDPLIPESVAQWVATDDREGPRRPLPRRRRRVGGLRGGRARVHRPAVAPRRDDRAGVGDRPVRRSRAQTDKPLRAQAVGRSRSPATGYQTYQAPAALHELLEGDPDAAPAVVDAAAAAGRPARAPRDAGARRRSPTVSGAPAATAKPAEAEPADEEPRSARCRSARSPAAPSSSRSSRSSSACRAAARPSRRRAKRRRLRAQGAGGLEARRRRRRSPALGTASAALAPPGAPGRRGRSRRAGCRPRSTRALARARRRVARVKLGAGEAVRIADGERDALRPADGRRPRRRRLQRGRPRSRAACPASAGSLELTQRHGGGAGPDRRGRARARAAR